jgi:hypothetical protein
MIIYCHGHYTTAPPQLQLFRAGRVFGRLDRVLKERGLLS